MDTLWFIRLLTVKMASSQIVPLPRLECGYPMMLTF